MGTGAKVGTGAAGLGAAGAAAAALRHDSEVHDQSAVPVYHLPTSQLPGSGTTHNPEEKRVPIAGPPADLHRTTDTNTNIDRGANITDADMHSHITPKAAIVTAGTVLGAAALPAATHHNQPDTTTSTGAVPHSENIHADERHDRILSRNEHTAHAHGDKVPIRHNTSTIATTGAPPEVFLNRVEYVPVERVHHYKQHHQHFLPRDSDHD